MYPWGQRGGPIFNLKLFFFVIYNSHQLNYTIPDKKFSSGRVPLPGWPKNHKSTIILSKAWGSLFLHLTMANFAFVRVKIFYNPFGFKSCWCVSFVLRHFYICTFLHLLTCTFVNLYICTFVHLYICTFVHLYICTFSYRSFQSYQTYQRG